MAGIESLFENPLMFGLIVLAVGALVFAALKRLLKLALIFMLGLGGLAGYYAYTGRQAPAGLERVQNKVKAGAEKGAEGARRLGDKVKTTVKDAAGREAERAAKKLEEAAHKAIEEAVPQ